MDGELVMPTTDQNIWKPYFNKLEKLLVYVDNNTQLKHAINTNETLRAQIDNTADTHYIREIREATSPDILHQIKILTKQIKKLYKQTLEVSNQPFKTYPSYIPILLEDVTSINLSLNEAYRSRKLKRQIVTETMINKGLDYAKLYTLDKEDYKKNKHDRLLKDLHKRNIKYKLNEQTLTLALYININDLMNYANTDAVQVRVKSGYQYIARISHNFMRTVRHNGGLLIYTTPDICQIRQSHPQAKHPSYNESDTVKITEEDLGFVIVKAKFSRKN